MNRRNCAPRQSRPLCGDPGGAAGHASALPVRNSTTDRRQGNPEVAAGGRETPGIDRSQQDGHRLQSIHGIPSTNERVLPETTIYLVVLGGLNRWPTRSAVRSGWSKDDESDSITGPTATTRKTAQSSVPQAAKFVSQALKRDK